MKNYHITLVTPTGNIKDIVIANAVSINNTYIRFLDIKGHEVAVYPTNITVISKVEN